jgi:hypothetical protein
VSSLQKDSRRRQSMHGAKVQSCAGYPEDGREVAAMMPYAIYRAALRTVAGAFVFVYAMTVPAGIQAIVAWVVIKHREGR